MHGHLSQNVATFPLGNTEGAFLSHVLLNLHVTENHFQALKTRPVLDSAALPWDSK